MALTILTVQKSFKPTSQQRADMELVDEPLNNGSTAVHEAAADLLRQQGFSADVPEEEEQVKETMDALVYILSPCSQSCCLTTSVVLFTR